MRIASRLTLAGVLFSVIALSPARSHALFHISVIDEVLASLDGDASQQFIEVRMLFDSQNLVSNAVLASFDASGTYVEDILLIPNDVPNGVDGARWIAATEAFQTANGFTADFTMPAGIPLGGGMICFGAPGILPPADPSSWDHTDPDNYVDCLAYGTYSGPGNHHVGTPTPLVPEGHSLTRRSETDDNAADFACADDATPTNNAGPCRFPSSRRRPAAVRSRHASEKRCGARCPGRRPRRAASSAARRARRGSRSRPTASAS